LPGKNFFFGFATKGKDDRKDSISVCFYLDAEKQISGIRKKGSENHVSLPFF